MVKKLYYASLICLLCSCGGGSSNSGDSAPAENWDLAKITQVANIKSSPVVGDWTIATYNVRMINPMPSEGAISFSDNGSYSIDCKGDEALVEFFEYTFSNGMPKSGTVSGTYKCYDVQWSESPKSGEIGIVFFDGSNNEIARAAFASSKLDFVSSQDGKVETVASTKLKK